MSQPVSIILVDDDPDEHLLFREDLIDAGVSFEFEAFTRAEEAVAHMQSRPAGPVLVLTDLSLAGDGALELIEGCQPHLYGGAVGCYSGTHNPDMEARCSERGSSFYIVKPVTREALLRVVETLDGFGVADAPGGKISIVCNP